VSNNITLYGISNCDTVRKAKNWLKQHDICFEFVDIRKQVLSKALIEGWFHQLDWELILNRRSTSWRQLDESIRNDVKRANVISLLLKHPTLIKRPVLSYKKHLLVGFNTQHYQALLG